MPATPSLRLLVAAALAATLAGCGSTPRAQTSTPADRRASLALHLDADDADSAATAPISFERRWTGNPLRPGDMAADLHEIIVRLTPPPAAPGSLAAGHGELPPREAVLLFPDDQLVVTDGAGARVQVVTVQRPAVTLTLARAAGAVDESGVARITFAPFFQETLFDLDPQVRADEALWLAVLGASVDDTRVFADARADFSINETIRLAELGVDPYDIRALEDTGGVLRFDELIALHDAGVTVADAVEYSTHGVPVEFDALVAYQRETAAIVARTPASAPTAPPAAPDDAAADETAFDPTIDAGLDPAVAAAPFTAVTEPHAHADESIDVQSPDAAANPTAERDGPAADITAPAAETPSPRDGLLAWDDGADDRRQTVVEIFDFTDADTDETTRTFEPQPTASARDRAAASTTPAVAVADPVEPVTPRVTATPSRIPALYAAQLAPLGFSDADDVAALFDAGVTADEVLWFRNAGMDPTAADLIDARRLGLDPGAARLLTDAGYDLTFEDLKVLHAAGTNPAYAAALFDRRFRPLTAEQIADLWDKRVSLADIRTARERRLSEMQSRR